MKQKPLVIWANGRIMRLWDKYLDNLSSEEVQQWKKHYFFECLLEEIQEITPLYDFAFRQIETHLFIAEAIKRDILQRPDQDLNDVLKIPALIFQLGTERDPVDKVGIYRCVNRWAPDNCKSGEHGLNSFLDEIFNKEETPQSEEEWLRLMEILHCVPDWSDPPPYSWKYKR
jgi:hypothetical protein